MRLCIHGRAARNCRHQVPFVNGFYGCTNTKRNLLELEWCGSRPEECKGWEQAHITTVEEKVTSKAVADMEACGNSVEECKWKDKEVDSKVEPIKGK